ncbi:MAG TPA: L-glutamate gamma-semialdehyde dehydrogenase [Planctomycetaceae bacterium]|nr:L-glutamate gamma-semialdehyde dehydrogenase [Planctomycetaceae bacterium]
MATGKAAHLSNTIEEETRRLGAEIRERLHHRRPSVFERRWWDDRILDWAMTDESVKIQMFRFVDVLPMLRDHVSVTRHLQEYFEEVRDRLPWAARLGLDLSKPNTVLGRAVAYNARNNARRMADRFIAGHGPGEVFQSVQQLRDNGYAFTLDLLGEAVLTEAESDAYQQAYLNMISELGSKTAQWPVNTILDNDQFGPVPRINVSLKLSSLDSQFHPIDPAGTSETVKRRLRPILRAAREHDAFVYVDMEQYSYKNLTISIFQEILMEDEFRDFPDAGIAIQAYLTDTDRDLHQLLEWVQKRGTPIGIRLVKGAYWDYETVHAAYRGWPVPVYQQKWESDANFERQTQFLMEHSQWLKPALGSHNLRSLAHGLAWVKQLDLAPGSYEIQMLYGMGDEQAEAIAGLGHRVRIYAPFGEPIPGMAYLVRRLLENTSNASFLRLSIDRDLDLDRLFTNPVETGASMPPVEETIVSGFQNEPLTDFSIAENRQAMREALDEVSDRFGEEYLLVIGGKAEDTNKKFASVNPSRPKQILGTVASANEDQAIEAIDAARRAQKEWANVEVDHRAEYLELIAAEMRNQRFELAAWIVYEAGKPWAEADADVAEAIDFCMYYADQMRRLDEPRKCDHPGEENTYFYRPRGVAVIIAPWNFPLAILTGMTVAALVTGNTVVMKPAEQSSVIAAQLMKIVHDAGLPDGVINFLPGVGEEIGPELVGSPDVDIIAFTGSKQVGLSINELASKTDDRQSSVKRIIAEMGGKNAIIIDDDADLDEAVSGTIKSAFGYAGQKCSACSRVIVLEKVYNQFVDRLIAAAGSLKVGPADDPGVFYGPVIDKDAFDNIQDYIEIGRGEAELKFAGTVPTDEGSGWFIGPHIFVGVEPDARIAQEEIFGPVLAVIKADDLDHAIEIANGTPYGLTGGLYSRSPKNLKKARDRFLVGNLYLNREITGALVERQPFGGLRMSGIGSKAGGPDYLLQFLVPFNVTENTMRHGFAPEPEQLQK